MARKNQLVQFNTFVGGLVTEASPLTFPDNSSRDEINFELNRDGSRRRRLGFDLEEDFVGQITGSYYPTNNDLALNFHAWNNVGGEAGRKLLVFQVGRTIKFYDPNYSPISSGLIHTYTYSGITDDLSLSFADIDGVLICAGARQFGRVDMFSIDQDTGSIVKSDYELKIRDVFGLAAPLGSIPDLGDPEYVSKRYEFVPDQHVYNLRNQGWAIPRLRSDSNVIEDPIRFFRIVSPDLYPSNADTVIQSLYPNPDISSDRISRRFMPKDLLTNPIGGNTPAPRGYFIINALNRGSSRSILWYQLHIDELVLDYTSIAFPSDRTPGSATCIATYAGRVFYAGFSGEVINGDARSPNLSSYILFSKLVDNKSDLGKCFQEGDPTSDDSPDLVDTDGGFIKLNDAYGIKKLINIGKDLIVLAENGVWVITGGNDYGFTATNHLVSKLSEHGCLSAKSCVLVDSTAMYWSDDGIYHIKKNQYGDMEVVNISSDKIQTLYNNISPEAKLYVAGIYDSYEKKVRWIYNNKSTSTDPVEELILDLTLGAFYKFKIGNAVISKRRICIPFEVPPYNLNTIDEDVYNNSDQVFYGSDEVQIELKTTVGGVREVMYLVLIDDGPSGEVRFGFGSYRDITFYDWANTTGFPIDAAAYLYTGYMSGGEFMLNKQVPYVTFYFERTETGFDTVGLDLVPRNQSSCKVRSLWEWSDSINSGRWGREFQAYRYNRHFIPSTSASPFDYGQNVIVTKNKLRGKGRVLSLYISTEPGKDCRLLGWSMMVSADGNA